MKWLTLGYDQDVFSGDAPINRRAIGMMALVTALTCPVIGFAGMMDPKGHKNSKTLAAAFIAGGGIVLNNIALKTPIQR
jgi:hypothetical protein